MNLLQKIKTRFSPLKFETGWGERKTILKCMPMTACSKWANEHRFECIAKVRDKKCFHYPILHFTLNRIVKSVFILLYFSFLKVCTKSLIISLWQCTVSSTCDHKWSFWRDSWSKIFGIFNTLPFECKTIFKNCWAILNTLGSRKKRKEK